MTGAADLTALPAMDVSGRARRCVDAFGTLGCAGLMVTKPVNVRWLTGFTGSSGRVLLTESGETVLFTDGRYAEQGAIELEAAGVDAEIIITRTFDEALAERWASGPGGPLGVESHHLTIDGLAQLAAALATTSPIVEVGPLVDTLRQPKDEGEIARLRAAAAIADEALRRHDAEILGGGLTERALARSLENAMYELGADGISFDTIVAAGENSARPHARPSDVVITPGDLLVIDFGASVHGYGSDMTRTFVCGGEPTERQQALYDAVLESQTLGRRAVKAGADQRSIDDACRASLAGAGLGDAFVHGTGHGIGLEIHEQPILSQRSVGILAADLVVTVEPGVYIAGTGGVRIEDSVVVTNGGCEPITHFPKGLVPWPLFPRTT